MKIVSILFLLLFTLSSADAEVISNKHFKLKLPDSMHVESSEGMILASGVNKPNSLPFLSIEYGDKLDLNRLMRDVNKELSESSANSALKAVSCAGDCRAYFGYVLKTMGQEKLNAFFYLIKGKTITISISYISQGDKSVGQTFIEDLARQIMKGNI